MSNTEPSVMKFEYIEEVWKPFRIHYTGIWLGIICWLLSATGPQAGCEQNILKRNLHNLIMWESFDNDMSALGI